MSKREDNTKIYSTLYGTASGGKTKIYNIHVENLDSKGALIIMEHGFEDGKISVQKREITEGKNIGKKNETTPFEQACSDAQSKWNKKKDEGYTENKKAQKTQDCLLPMLALKYEERKHDITFPCYVQPKLDGVRCITKFDGDKIIHLSRQGKEFTTFQHMNQEIAEFLAVLPDGYILDGEIYSHNDDVFMTAAMEDRKEKAEEKDPNDNEKISSFQSIIAAVKKKRKSTQYLKYYIYDLADPTSTFEERNEVLVLMSQTIDMKNIVIVPTYLVNDEAEIIKYHNQFVAEGYEGVIIRNGDGKYTFKHRSKDLQKWKYFKDEEFTITGGKEATGEDKGTVVFICDAGNGKTFECRPRGSRELRKRWFENIESLKGRRLTVRYQELTDEGKPRFPVGITVRDYE